MRKTTYEIFSKYRTLLMGIATISVLIFHFTDDFRIYKYHYDGFLRLFNRYVSGSGVDIFLMLSGMGLYYAWKKNNNYPTFLAKRFRRVLIPYAIIGIPAYFIRDVLLRDLPLTQAVRGFFFYNFLTKGETWHWYIFMILLCYIAFPWIYAIVEEYKTKIQSQMAMLSIFSFVSVIAILLNLYAPDVFDNINIMILRIPVFVFGVFVGKASYEKRPIGYEWIVFGVIAFIIAPLRETSKIIFIRYTVGALNIFFAYLFVRMFDCLHERNIPIKCVEKILTWIGNHSLEMYLSHVTVRTILCKSGYYTYQIQYFLIEVLLTLIISVIVSKVTAVLIQRFTSKGMVSR